MNVENTRPRARNDTGQATPESVARASAVASHKREVLRDLIREQVLHALGEPGDLLKVQVAPLWQDNYRVNVYVGADAACARIPHSYFVMVDGDGNVLDSTPKIQRQY